MELADYLKSYVDAPSEARLTTKLEQMAKHLHKLFDLCGDHPDEESASFARNFLIEVEKWKQLCIRSRMGLAAKNSPDSIWHSLLAVAKAESDIEAFRAIMQLVGFGKSVDQKTGRRRAKQGSAVLRFINPERWGVVDWRNAAMLKFYQKACDDADNAVEKASRENPQKWRKIFNIIDEEQASHYQEKYRALRSARLPRAADVDLALWSMSLKAWPLPK